MLSAGICYLKQLEIQEEFQ